MPNETDDDNESFGGEDHLVQAMAYQDNYLEGQDKVNFEAHLATCAECQRAIAFANRNFAALDAAIAAEAGFQRPAALATRTRGPRVRWMVRAVVLTVAAAAVLAIALLGRPLMSALSPEQDRNTHAAPPPRPDR